MARSDGTAMGVPVAVVTDCDVKQYEVDPSTKQRQFKDKPKEAKAAVEHKQVLYGNADVKAFVSPKWTLEYCLAMSCLQKLLIRAILFGKKVYNSDADPLSDNKAKAVESEIVSEVSRITAVQTKEEQAYEVYEMMLENDGRSKLKAIVAHCLASLIRWEVSDIPQGYGYEHIFDYELLGISANEAKKSHLRQNIEDDPSLRYLVDAIRYACGLDPIQGD